MDVCTDAGTNVLSEIPIVVMTSSVSGFENDGRGWWLRAARNDKEADRRQSHVVKKFIHEPFV